MLDRQDFDRSAGWGLTVLTPRAYALAKSTAFHRNGAPALLRLALPHFVDEFDAGGFNQARL